MAIVVRRGERYGEVDCDVECDQRGCWAFVTLRDDGNPDPDGALALAAAAMARAEAEGWSLTGSTYCPRHAPGRLERPATVGERYMWARIAVEGVKGGQRPS